MIEGIGDSSQVRAVAVFNSDIDGLRKMYLIDGSISDPEFIRRVNIYNGWRRLGNRNGAYLGVLFEDPRQPAIADNVAESLAHYPNLEGRLQDMETAVLRDIINKSHPVQRTVVKTALRLIKWFNR